MPVDPVNSQKTNAIYPEAKAFINPNSTTTVIAPTSSNKDEALPEPPQRKHKLIALLVIILLLIGLAAGVFALRGKHADGKDDSANLPLTVSQASYYLPKEDYQGYTYKYSGYSVFIKRDFSKQKVLVTEFEATKGDNLAVWQVLDEQQNECIIKPESCDTTYTTPRGRKIYPRKEAGANILIDGKLLRATQITLETPAQKEAFTKYVDSLEAISATRIKEYDHKLRQKEAWSKLYDLSYPLYSPVDAPNGLPIRAQDVVSKDGIFGPSTPYLFTKFTNKASNFEIDNSSSTYQFLTYQVAKPAGFSPATNCTIGTKTYQCKEMLEVATSPTQKAVVDIGKYHLYKDATYGGYISTTLIADFGQTVMVIEMYGPTNVFKEELGAALVNSLNTMRPTSLAELPLVSVNMTDSL